MGGRRWCQLAVIREKGLLILIKKYLRPIKNVVQSLTPVLYTAMKKAKDRAVAKSVLAHLGNTVAGGPFTGMKYIPEATGSAFTPKLVGSYEAELFPVIAHAGKSKYDAIIDVGCAEGYYAVGFALVFPVTPVVAYDIDPHAQQLCMDLAVLNGVQGRVAILGSCGPDDLIARTGQRLLVISDCEGYEGDLFTAPVAEALGNSDVIIELHEENAPGLTNKITTVFKETHLQQMLPVTPRRVRDFPALKKIPLIYRRFAFDELRFKDNQNWLWLTPKKPITEQ